MAVLLKDAIMPNLVQTLEGTPAFVHGGPFANIAHGCNSLIATRMALKLGDIVVTEAGFASDLGAEKFFDIKCRSGGLTPSAAVIVATVRALKMHGGVALDDLGKENVAAVGAASRTWPSTWRTSRHFGLPAVVAINHFPADTDAEVARREGRAAGRWACRRRPRGCWATAAPAARTLAEAVLEAMRGPAPPLPAALSRRARRSTRKIEAIATKIYGADGVDVPAGGRGQARSATSSSATARLPVCMAKTQNSLSDDAKKLGPARAASRHGARRRARRRRRLRRGLRRRHHDHARAPKAPGAETIDVDADGNIVGLF